MSARPVAARPCGPLPAGSRKRPRAAVREEMPPRAPDEGISWPAPRSPAISSRPRQAAALARAPLAPRSCACLLAAALLAPACFSDGGYHPAGATAPTTDDAGTTTTTSTTSTTTGPDAPATTTTTTGEPAPVCGDGVVDPDTEACDDGNADDGDACLGTCVAASCGDGVVWLGVEDCDLGASNHPTAPDTCRPTCKLPACGDGGLYVGPLGPDLALPVGEEAIDGGNDAPRMIGAAADGSFVVTWHTPNLLAKVQARRIDGAGQPLAGVVELLEQPFWQIRDSVIAVAPSGDFAVAWHSQLEESRLFVRSVAADAPAPAVQLTAVTATSPALGLDASGALIAAWRAGPGKQTPQIWLRRFPLLTDPASPPEQAISDHPLGEVGSPTIAVHESGSFLVAWSDPDGAIVYRRFTPDLVADPPVTTGLFVGGGTNSSARPWTGAVVQPDGAAVIAGRDVDGHLVLQRFDAADVAGPRVQVDDLDALHVPFVDVASDASGHLAVAWSTCGAPGDDAPTCADLPAVSWFRRFYGDLTPHGPAVEVATRTGMPRPLSLAVAPTGAAAVARIEGDKVLLNMSPVQCPP